MFWTFISGIVICLVYMLLKHTTDMYQQMSTSSPTVNLDGKRFTTEFHQLEENILTNIKEIRKSNSQNWNLESHLFNYIWCERYFMVVESANLHGKFSSYGLPIQRISAYMNSSSSSIFSSLESQWDRLLPIQYEQRKPTNVKSNANQTHSTSLTVLSIFGDEYGAFVHVDKIKQSLVFKLLQISDRTDDDVPPVSFLFAIDVRELSTHMSEVHLLHFYGTKTYFKSIHYLYYAKLFPGLLLDYIDKQSKQQSISS